MATPTASPVERPRTPEEIERDWLVNVYQGDRMRQLTVRAAVMGMLLGSLMCVSNLYVGLKIGWSLGVAITSCILAYTVFATLHKLLPRLFPAFTILENNAMQSAASAAGSMTSAGMVNALPALMMLDPAAVPRSQAWIVLWIAVVSFLGVFLAIPAKRQLINLEQLPFPSGIAAAATMRTLHAQGGEARRQARALVAATGIGAVITFFRDASSPYLPWKDHPPIPSTWAAAHS